MSDLTDLQRRLDAIKPRLRGYELRLCLDRTGLPIVELWKDGWRVTVQSARPWLDEMERQDAYRALT